MNDLDKKFELAIKTAQTSDEATMIKMLHKDTREAIKQLLVEARMNELEKHLCYESGKAGSIHINRQEVDDRIAELKGQL